MSPSIQELRQLEADMAQRRAEADAQARAAALKEVLSELKQERARMVSGSNYTLANVYGMNNAVDVVQRLIKEETDG